MKFTISVFVKNNITNTKTYSKVQSKHFIEWLGVLLKEHPGAFSPEKVTASSGVSWWLDDTGTEDEVCKRIREMFIAWLDEAHPELLAKKGAKTSVKRSSSAAAKGTKPKEESVPEKPAEPSPAPVPAPKPAPVPAPKPVPAPMPVPEPLPVPPKAPAAPVVPPPAPKPVPAPAPVPAPVVPRPAVPVPVPVPKPVPAPMPVPKPIPVPPKAPAAPVVPPPAPKPVPAPVPAPAVPRPAAPAAPAVPPPAPAVRRPVPVPAPRPVVPAVKTPPTITHTSAVPKAGTSVGASALGNASGAKPDFVENKKKVTLRAPVIVKDMALALNLPMFRIVQVAMNMKIFASTSTVLEDEVAVKIGDYLGFAVDIHRRGEKPTIRQVVKPPVEKADDTKDLAPRPPVVCVMGHVDHGKTTLLDFYRKSNVTAGEAGGITQHVAAYSVKHGDKTITFLDTPGHAAFSKMRERGAELTDIAVLVVAADDGFMPQTDEALKFIQKSNVQLVVAINKVDSRGANVDRVKQQMQKRGIAPEDWGGEIQTEAVSALKGVNMDGLLDAILLQAEMMELKANPKAVVEGTVVEAQMEQGRGPTATVIVQRGTLKPGDALVCGQFSCRVRAIFDEYNKPLKSIAPGCPGRVMGWSGIPSAGAIFSGAKNPREAERIAEENALALRKAIEEQQEADAKEDELDSKKMSDLAALNALLAGNSEKVFKVFTKADVDGTLEALNASLESIKSSKVKLEIVGGSVGPITPSEVAAAAAAKATIVAFDVKPANGVPAMLKQQGVSLISHDIIYFLLDNVKDAMADLLDPVFRENIVGRAECRKVLELSKLTVAGSMVLSGYIHRDYSARLIRGKQVLHTGRIDTLKRFKDDVTEVKEGYECGICITGFDKYEEGDIIECFEMLKERQTL